MITVEDANTVASSRPKTHPKPEPALTEDGQTALDLADSVIESIIVRDFVGGMISTTIPAELVPLEVIQALKVRYEREGGWSFGIFPRVDPRDNLVHEILLVLAPSTTGKELEAPSPERAAAQAAKLALPAIVAAVTQPAPGGLRLLLRMPTRARPVQALQVLQRYREMAGMPVDIEVVVDEDDATMLSAEVIQRLVAMECHVVVGRHKSKVEACNDGRVTEWDILALISDDMVPVQPGYAVKICEAMRTHWPHLDGALFFNDGHVGEKLCTLPIFGRRIYDQFGYVYYSEYKSLWCDNEQTEVLRAMGRLTYVDDVIIEHRHPANVGGGQMDSLYRRNEALWGPDEETCKRRRATVRPNAAWGFDSPPLWLSIGILTFPARRAMLEHFLKELYAQIVRDRPRQVELIVEDNPAGSLGAKRQRVLDRANGRFVCFVDDDDWLTHNYIERVVSALESDPEADCASFVGTLTTNGVRPERFEHSLKYDKWETKDGLYVRCPNHLSAVKTSIAKEVGFADLTYVEDRDYSERLRGKLKREVSTGEAPLYLYFYRSKNPHVGEVR